MKARKIAALCMALVMIAALLAGCSGLTDEDNSPPESNAGISNNGNSESSYHVIRFGTEYDPGSLAPWDSANGGRKQMIYETYEFLAQIQGKGGELEPVIAESWEHPDDYTYIIHLHDDVFDTNGNQITADDVLFSFEGAKDQQKQNLKYMESLTKDDDFTLTMKLNSTTVGAFERIMYMVAIVDEDSYQASPDGMITTPVGTGPYVIDHYVEGSELVLIKNENYWAKDKSQVFYQQQNVDEIRFIIIPEAAQRSIAMETGDVDIISNVSQNEVERFVNNDNYTVHEAYDGSQRALILNSNDQSPCNDVRVRQAILYAIDSAGVLDAICNGVGEVAYTFGGSIFPDVYDAWNDGNYYSYNPQKAKELLADAGYANGLELHLLTASSEITKNISLVLQNYLSDVGINVIIDAYESALTKTYVWDFSTWDIYLMACGSNDYNIKNLDNYLNGTGHTDDISYIGSKDDTLQSLLETCLDVRYHDEEHMTELHNYCKDNAYIYGIYNGRLYTVTSTDVLELAMESSDYIMPGSCTYSWN